MYWHAHSRISTTPTDFAISIIIAHDKCRWCFFNLMLTIGFCEQIKAICTLRVAAYASAGFGWKRHTFTLPVHVPDRRNLCACIFPCVCAYILYCVCTCILHICTYDVLKHRTKVCNAIQSKYTYMQDFGVVSIESILASFRYLCSTYIRITYMFRYVPTRVAHLTEVPE